MAVSLIEKIIITNGLLLIGFMVSIVNLFRSLKVDNYSAIFYGIMCLVFFVIFMTVAAVDRTEMQKGSLGKSQDLPFFETSI